MRIATMERTPPEVIEGVEAVLRAASPRSSRATTRRPAASSTWPSCSANVDRSTERVILDHLDKNAPELAAEVRKLTFTFDNLIQLDDPSLQRVLREVDAEDLAMALRGVAETLREKIFKNLSAAPPRCSARTSRSPARSRMRQVEEAQQRIVGIVRKLEESGDLVIQRGRRCPRLVRRSRPGTVASGDRAQPAFGQRTAPSDAAEHVGRPASARWCSGRWRSANAADGAAEQDSPSDSRSTSSGRGRARAPAARLRGAQGRGLERGVPAGLRRGAAAGGPGAAGDHRPAGGPAPGRRRRHRGAGAERWSPGGRAGAGRRREGDRPRGQIDPTGRPERRPLGPLRDPRRDRAPHPRQP